MTKPLTYAYIGIDPGLTTGWAVTVDGKALATGIWGTHELRTALDALIRWLHTHGYTTRVCVEKMPHTGQASTLAAKMEWVRREISIVVEETYELEAVEVPPGEWKTSRVSRQMSGKLPKMTPHQRDALRMVLYAQDAQKWRK